MYQFEMAMFHSYVSLLEGSAFNNLPNSEWYTIYTIYRYHMLMILLHNTSMIIYKQKLIVLVYHILNIYNPHVEHISYLPKKLLKTLIAQLTIDTILIITYQYFTSYWRYLCYKYSSGLVPGVDVNSDPQGIQVDHAQTNSLDRRRKFPSVMVSFCEEKVWKTTG